MKIKRKTFVGGILATLCACLALTFGALFSPKNTVSAEAAVDPDDFVKWESLGNYQLYIPNASLSNAYGRTATLSDMGAPNTSAGVSSFDADSAKATGTKITTGIKNYVVNYVHFKAVITVPAYTEYSLKISETMYINAKIGASGGKAHGWGDFYYYGETDKSNDVQFGFCSTTDPNYIIFNENGYIDPTGVTRYHNSILSTVAGTNQTYAPVGLYDEVLTNNTADKEEITLYFGFYSGTVPGNPNVYTFSDWVQMSTEIEVTPIANADSFGLDKTEDNYTGNDLQFTVQNMDNLRVVLTSFTRTKINGTTETLYTYSNNASEQTTGTNPLNGGVIKAVKAGTYTLKFEIYYWCGTVWNNVTNDQNPRTFTFTIKPKEIEKPTIADAQKEQAYTGSAIGFSFSSSLSTTDWAKYIKELDKSKMTVADNGDKDSVVDKKNKTVEITHSGTYNIKWELSDLENTVWAEPSSTTGGTTLNGITVGGTKDFTLKVKPATLTTTLVCSSIKDGNWTWDAGTEDVEITVDVAGFKLNSDTDESGSEHVTLAYYYRENKAGSAEVPLTGSDVVTEEIYSATAPLKITAKIKMPTSIKPNNDGYIFGVKPDGTSGANGNYVVKESEATHIFTVNSASLDPSTLVWTYTKDGVNSNAVLAQNGKITYETKEADGKRVAVVFSPYIWILKEGDGGYDYTDYVEISGNYSGATSANAVKGSDGRTTRQTTVTLKIKDSDKEHVFSNPTGSANVVLKDNGRTAEVTLNWEMEQKEITLTDVKFQYKSAPIVDKWTDYDHKNPPQKTGVSFIAQVPTVNLPEGVKSVTCTPDGNTKGPGTIKFTFDFELDENYKAKDGKSVLTYTMEVTGTQVNVNWVVTTLKDADGKEIKDNGIPYQIYKLDVPESDPAYKFIKYKYYKVNTVDGEYVKGDEIVGGIDEVVKAVADGGLGASSTNLVQVYCEVYLDGMGKDNGVDPFVLKTSEKQKDYKVYYVGESKDAIDVTAGVSEIIYGNGGNALGANDLYELVIRDSGGIALGVNFYKVSLYDKDEKTCIAEDIRDADGKLTYDFLKLGVGEYKLVFELINGADEDYILTSTNLPFTVKAVELTAPSLKDGVTFKYNGEVQSIVNNLDGFDGDYMEFAVKAFNDGVKNAGEYIVLIKIKDEYKGNYVFAVPDTESSDITPDTALIKITVEKIEIALPTVGEILFSGEYINLVDYLGGSYADYKDIISISGDYQDLRNVSQSGYKARLTLTDPNYKWAKPATVEPASLKLFAAKLYDNELAVLDDVTAELKWNIAPLVVDATEMWAKGKNGATLNLPENINKLITGETLSVLYRYYDDADQYIETPELKGGRSFRVEAVFGGIDAEAGNVLFKTADGIFNAVSDKISYTVPQSGAEAFFGSTLSFLKANWLWIVIAAVALILLILIIALAARAAKKKREREEQRRLEEKEEKKREQEERKREQEERRREDREERMARMNQQQMMMPQMMPQMPMQQSMPQAAAQPMAGGASSSELAELKAEISALRAAQESMRAEQTAKELAEIKALHTAEQQIAQAKTDMRVDSLSSRLGGEQLISGGVTAATLVEMVTAAMEKVLDRREKPAAQSATATPEAAPAATQVPPDAVMTTVTTTKIDTTKKPAQTAERAQAPAPAVRTVVRNVVAPMPVDDGRVFDVGGFYKPADPITDMDLTDDENKE